MILMKKKKSLEDEIKNLKIENDINYLCSIK